MHPNEQLICDFYEAFRRKDFKTMQRSYHEDAVFNDEVFHDLSANEVKAMWEMLIKKGKDLVIEYNDVEANEQTGCAEWVAYYTFSKSKRKVENKIKASFEFKDGKIYRHSDSFSFPKWASQALGFSGKLFGRSKWLRQKVQDEAKSGLRKFMST